MMRRKGLVSAALATLLALTMTACGGDSSTPTNDDGSGSDAGGTPEYTIKVGHTLQEDTPAHKAWLLFEEQVEANSEGRIAVELYPNSSLGTERVMFEACQMGTLEVAYGTTSVLANFDKNMEVLDLPFLFEDEATARAAITGELGTAAAANLGDIGLINLTYMENGIRHVTNSSHPINTPDDLRDLKIRTMENSIHMSSFTHLGASPTPMAFTELFTALQQGTVDGQDNGAELTWQSKFQEVQKYYVYTKHIYSPYVILMSGETFNGLTPEEQEIIMKISDEAVAYERERCSEYEAVALENIKSYPGMNYAELSPEVVEEMKAACAGIKDLAYEKVEHPEVIDLLYSEAEKAKEKYPAEQTTDAPAQTEADAAPAA